MKLLRGIGRKLAIPVLVVSILGWVLYVVGFAAFNESDTYYNDLTTVGLNYTNADGVSIVISASANVPARRAGIDFFPYWCFLITAPFLYFNNFLHLIIGRWFTGLSNHFLTALYLVVGGAVLYGSALALFSTTAGIGVVLNPPAGWLTDPYWGLWELIEWIGCLFSVFFMVMYMMMWVFFKTKKQPQSDQGEYYDEEEEEGGDKEEEGQAEEQQEQAL